MNKKKKYQRRLLAFEPSLHFSGVGVGLRVMVTGRRHGVVRLWWFHPIRRFPITHHRHSPSSLLVISLLFPRRLLIVTCCCLSIVPRCCLPVVPSFFLLIVPRRRLLPPANHTKQVLGHLLSTTRRVCHVLVSSELLLVAEVGLGRLVSATIVTSSLESKK